jgi:hypothetical protein
VKFNLQNHQRGVTNASASIAYNTRVNAEFANANILDFIKQSKTVIGF